MAVPRNRQSNARKNTRRAHHAKKPVFFVVCRNCNAQKLPHCVCQSCGVYGGRIVVKSKEQETRE